MPNTPHTRLKKTAFDLDYGRKPKTEITTLLNGNYISAKAETIQIFSFNVVIRPDERIRQVIHTESGQPEPQPRTEDCWKRITALHNPWEKPKRYKTAQLKKGECSIVWVVSKRYVHIPSLKHLSIIIIDALCLYILIKAPANICTIMLMTEVDRSVH